jgi:hypothetical protein
MMKTCNTCKTGKPLVDFYKSKSGRLGTMARCKTCVLEEMRIAYATNPEPKKRQSAAWKASHPGATYANNKKNRALYPDKRKPVERAYRQRHPDRMLARTRAWRAKHPGIGAAYVAKYFASRLQATPPWADLDKIKAIYAEAARLTKATGIRHEVDHIHPLQSKVMCGLHVPANLQILPMSENRSKSNRSWPETHPLLAVAA